MEVNSEETFKYIPFRLYQGDKPFSQKLVKPVNEEGQKKTLFNFLQEIYADDASKGIPLSSLNTSKLMYVSVDLFSLWFSLLPFLVKVTTHGVEPPPDTPLQWMSEHLSYPDNFLHLCIAF